MSVLIMESVGHAYGGKVVVSDLSLSIDEGEILCLLGPSGCGKSTILRLAAGLETLQRGIISIDGRVVAGGNQSVPPERRNIGMMFQDYALFPHLNVLDNVAFGAPGSSKKQRRNAAAAMLEQIGITRFNASYPHILSGGEQQRVALARALVAQPRVMLMDEPFSELDMFLRDKLRDESLEMLRRAGAATLLVTHDPEEALRMADRVAIIHEGTIVQTGIPEEIYRWPANASVARFFGDINTIEGAVRDGVVITPIGNFDVQRQKLDLADGAAVEVLLRPESLALAGDSAPKGHNRIVATVVRERFLGKQELVDFQLSSENNKPGQIIKARLSSRHIPKAGAVMPLSYNIEEAFIFPKEEAS